MLTKCGSGLYAIEAAIVVHLEIRRAWKELTYRDEFSAIVGGYLRRLRELYEETAFGRSDVDYFLKQYAIVSLVSANQFRFALCPEFRAVLLPERL